MNYTIKNDKLSVTIADMGAELQSIRTCGGTELLWQGDSRSWSGKAPNIFPYVGRLTDKKYTVNGREYSMDIHGFAKDNIFTVKQKGGYTLEFTLKSTEETRAQYPFEFEYSIEYALDGETLSITSLVRNHSPGAMYFGLGGHPGFNVPWQNGLEFSDYYIEFEKDAKPLRLNMTRGCFVGGGCEPLELDDNRLNLRQSLFDNDAIVLKEMGKSVVLASGKGAGKITICFDDMPYLGLWNWPACAVNYVCIEPWLSLPSRQGVVEEFTEQKDLIALEPGGAYANTWSITAQ